MIFFFLVISNFLCWAQYCDHDVIPPKLDPFNHLKDQYKGCNCPPADAPDVSSTNLVVDDCDHEPEVTFKELRIEGHCPANYTIRRRWEAKDKAGNRGHLTQDIYVHDETPPIIMNTPVHFQNEVGHTDMAQELMRAHQIKLTNDLWVLPCHQVPGPAKIKAIDLCDDHPGGKKEVKVNFIENIINYGGDNPQNLWEPHLILRSWSASDECGNTATFMQSILVVDANPPTLVGVKESTKNYEIGRVPPHCTANAHDDCNVHVEVQFEERTSLGSCKSDYTLYRTWSATDTSGHQTSVTETVIVADNTPPHIHHPPPAIFEVSSDQIPMFNMIASDNSNEDIKVKKDVEKTEVDSNGIYKLYWTWSATDSCGNTQEFLQTIIVTEVEGGINSGDMDGMTNTDDSESTHQIDDHKDNAINPCLGYTQVPIFFGISHAPTDIILEYHNGIQLPPPPVVTAKAFNSNDLTVHFAENQIRGTSDHSYTMVRTWTTAQDECGKFNTVTQKLIVQDTSKPHLSEYPHDLHVSCDQIPAACKVRIKGEDEAIDVHFSETTLEKDSDVQYTLLRTWNAKDKAGNAIHHDQTIYVYDHSPPVMSREPEDQTVECNCDKEPPVPHILSMDNCDHGEITVKFTEHNLNAPHSENIEAILIRVWSVTDSTGNTYDHAQTLTVKDTKQPQLLPSLPAMNVYYSKDECDEVIKHHDYKFERLMAFDNCDRHSLAEFSVNVEEDGTDTLKRTWRLRDKTGNVLEHSQRITCRKDPGNSLVVSSSHHSGSKHNSIRKPVYGTLHSTKRASKPGHLRKYHPLVYHSPEGFKHQQQKKSKVTKTLHFKVHSGQWTSKAAAVPQLHVDH